MPPALENHTVPGPVAAPPELAPPPKGGAAPLPGSAPVDSQVQSSQSFFSGGGGHTAWVMVGAVRLTVV